MLFMAIFTYEPAKGSEVLKRRTEKGPLTAGKIIGEWTSIAGGQVFRVVELDDPKVALAASRAWSDLGEIDLIPIMETEEVIKLASKK